MTVLIPMSADPVTFGHIWLIEEAEGTLYGSQNIANVRKTLAIIPGSKAIAPVIDPSLGTKSLI